MIPKPIMGMLQRRAWAQSCLHSGSCTAGVAAAAAAEAPLLAWRALKLSRPLCAGIGPLDNPFLLGVSRLLNVYKKARGAGPRALAADHINLCEATRAFFITSCESII